MGEDRTSSLAPLLPVKPSCVSSGSARPCPSLLWVVSLGVGGYVAGTQMGCLPSYLVILDMALPAGNTQATGEGPQKGHLLCYVSGWLRGA